MRPSNLSTLVASMLVAFSAASDAQVVNVSQTRTLRATGGGTVSETNSGVGSWNRTVTNFDPMFGHGGEAGMESSISTTHIRASGSTLARDANQGFAGSASSSIVATFDVVVDTPFRLNGSWNTDFDFHAQNPAVSFRFERLSPAPEVFHASAFSFDYFAGTSVTNGSAALSGNLPAGRYRIAMSHAMAVFGNPGFFSGATSYAFDLQTPPCAMPAITTDPVAGMACLGSPATFTVVASGTGPLSHRWQVETPSGTWSDLVDGPFSISGVRTCAIISGARSPALVVGTTCAAGPGSFAGMAVRAVVTNDCGTDTSAVASLANCAGEDPCISDVDRDGDTDSDDVIVFFAAWDLGC